MKYIFYINENKYNLSINELINFIKTNPYQKYYKIINNEKILINNNIVCNTQFICHRINTIQELKNIDTSFGVELDIRDEKTSNKLILSHDPFIQGEDFETYLKSYKHNTLIFNIKSERIELECLKLIKKYSINNYFFLDSSFPMIYILNKKYLNNNIASRYSEFECIEFTENIKDLIQWIWIDCFNYLPLNKEIYERIIKLKKKICIVSPELHGQPEKISEYRQQLIDNNIIPDAICCKKYNIYEWI